MLMPPPIPPWPPAALVDDGIAIPVAVGTIPDMAIEAEDIMLLWSMAISATRVLTIGSWCGIVISGCVEE